MKTASEPKREALLASQSTATVVGSLASEYAGHSIAALVMPGRVDAEQDTKARKLLPLVEALARSLRSFLDADTSSGAPSYVFAMSGREFATVLVALSSYRVLLDKFGAAASTIDLADDAGAPRPIEDTDVIEAFQERLVASAGLQA